MSRLREFVEEGFYHVYNRGVEKRNIFMDDVDREVFLNLLGQMLKLHQAKAFAYCLMENHYHLYLQTMEPNLHILMQRFICGYVRYFNKRHDRVGTLFQGRYQCKLVQRDAYAVTLLDYIHDNPKEALISAPDSYYWSSRPAYLGHAPAPDWLDTRTLSEY